MKKVFLALVVAASFVACDNAGSDKPATNDSPKVAVDSPKPAVVDSPKPAVVDSPKPAAKVDSPKTK